MFDEVEFTSVPGKNTSLDLKVLALSSCGFCKRGMDFLQERGFAYKYIHLDLLEPEVKQRFKEEFKAKFKSNLSYPALILNDEKFTIGYIKRYWEDLLGIKSDTDITEAEPLE